MLQPHKPTVEQQLVTARIIWAALCMSMLIYGFVLYTTGKVSHVEELSTVPSMIQYLAVMANVLALGVYYFYKNKVVTEPDFEKRFPFYVICWALNESIVVMGFVAVFLADDGNGLLYLTNLAVGLAANMLTYPRK